MTLKITIPTMYEEHFAPRYQVTVTELPPDLTSTHPLTGILDPRSIKVPKTAGSIHLLLETQDRKHTVATAVFAAVEDVVRCDSIDVMPDYRRQGVATGLYRLASRIFRAPVVPTDNQTEDAKAFWGIKKRISHALK